MQIDKVALIFVRNKKLLSVVPKGKNVFYMPGGKREAGESDEQTLMREIKEEMSVNIITESIKYYGTFEAEAHDQKKGTVVRAICYTAAFEGEPKPSSEIESIAWLSSADANKVPPLGKLILADLKKKGLIE